MWKILSIGSLPSLTSAEPPQLFRLVAAFVFLVDHYPIHGRECRHIQDQGKFPLKRADLKRVAYKMLQNLHKVFDNNMI